MLMALIATAGLLAAISSATSRAQSPVPIIVNTRDGSEGDCDEPVEKPRGKAAAVVS
jgi:hypothetical protein